MILLTAAKMPDGLDKNTLANAVRLMFPNSENHNYLCEIQNRSSNTSACESLFALALTYDLLLSLPCSLADTSDLIIKRSENGKPYFVNSNVKFNISHSKGYVACAVSDGEELGIDVEASLLSPERAKKLADRYFNSNEVEYVSSRPETFARLWCEKEAKAKFFGESIGNILSTDKYLKTDLHSNEIKLHSFSIDSVPVCLCTKRDYSTIHFTIQ